jgi:carbamoyl-phosphate synthase large subunit
MAQILNVMVLGVGGNVSQGILKALALSKVPCRVIGACISSLSFGLYTVDQAYISPPASDPAFQDWLIRLCRTEQVHAILSGVEPVLTVLAEAAGTIHAETGAVCIVSTPECLAVGNDKLLTTQWLGKNGFSFPKSVDAANSEGVDSLVRESGYPLIAKPRCGRGAQGVLELRGRGMRSGAVSSLHCQSTSESRQEYAWWAVFGDRNGMVGRRSCGATFGRGYYLSG